MGKKMNTGWFALFLIALLLFTAFFFSPVSATTPSSKVINGVVSKALSTMLKWLWSLIGSTTIAISGRPVMKYEEGYNVETVFDGSKLGIEPHSVEVLPNGEIMILDSVNSNIYKVSSPLSRYSKLKLVAGSSEGYSGHVDGKPRDARMNHPKGFTVDDKGNIYIADVKNMAIRKISEAGVTTIAGGKGGRGGRIDGPSEEAKFSPDFDVVYVQSSCSILVIDRGNQAIREIQLQYDDCGNQYELGFPVGIAVLVAACFFGYMLALLQLRENITLSFRNDMTSRKHNLNPYQQSSKYSVRPPLIPSEEEQEKQEAFFVSLGKLILNTGAALVEVVAGLFGFKRKSRSHQFQHQYRKQQRHSNGWPQQDSFVIPDEDEPPSIETKTPTPKKTYAFMAQDPEKTHHVRQSRAPYNGWDGDSQKQRQQKQQDMIRSIRACKTAAEERAVVRKECATIRASISENDHDYRHRNLAKLMFIHMLGYPTHFGQMECLKAIASAGFPEKRIGYLGLMLLLDERQEVLIDLNHTNQYIVGLALCALGNICSAEMARDLAPEVERLFQSRDPNIRKKAALCSVRIIKKVPDLAENFMSPAAALLKEKHHGAQIAGIQLCIDLCKVSPEALEYFRKVRPACGVLRGAQGTLTAMSGIAISHGPLVTRCTEGLVKALKDCVNSPYQPEYDVSGIADPFLHIRLLRLLRVLGEGDADASDCMNDILAQVATKTETNKNAGNAILYECVETIMSIEDNSGLRVLAINILGRFLSNRDNNIRYVALNMLTKAITVDAQAVQRHRVTILECVKDSDASIRKRALELIFLLVNESNVKPLTKELVEYLEVSDQEFREDLTAKICSIVEKFSLEKLWYIDQMLKVLSEAGNYVKDEVWHALIVVISNASDLQGYTVRSLYRALQTSGEQESLIRVAVWCIGEYGEMLVNNVGMLDNEDPITVTESDAVDVLEASLKQHTSDITTRAMSLVALLKLSSRFPSCSKRVKDIIIEYKGSFVLELQQRSMEFNSIIDKHQNIRSALLERMPVLDEASYSKRKAGSLLPTASTSHGAPPKLPNGVTKPPVPELGNLLDLGSDDSPMPSSSGADSFQDIFGLGLTSDPSISGTGQAPSNGTDALFRLLDIGTPPGRNDVSSPDILFTSQNSTSSGAPLERLASPSSPFSVQISSPASTPQMINLLDDISPSLLATNKNSSTDSDFTGKSGPTYPSIVAFQSSSLKIDFSFSKQTGNPQTTLINAKNLVMRIRIAYKANNQDVLEQAQINNFPPGL
ncbi:hypothetical protein IFM89_030240 [Coptis chinensis]|uniref:Clathrin/coatomer adaptor adaptin-like N-terminal domain-containing protein n=1 Tax=Coptis chinensis TaxID=261450 RepID=A0A835HZF0_9MAGN|nr:hypothetical protein IFM89_030240 [Coptis chinensis]